MLDNVYNAKIIEYAGNIEKLGELDAPDAKARVHSKLCGSTVEVTLTLDGSQVSDFAHKVKACALGQASSSIMAQTIIGATADELRNLKRSNVCDVKVRWSSAGGPVFGFQVSGAG